MDKNEATAILAAFGQEEARLMKALRKVQRQRCKFLRDAACHPETGLSPEALAKANEPKDD